MIRGDQEQIAHPIYDRHPLKYAGDGDVGQVKLTFKRDSHRDRVAAYTPKLNPRFVGELTLSRQITKNLMLLVISGTGASFDQRSQPIIMSAEHEFSVRPDGCCGVSKNLQPLLPRRQI